MWDELLKRKRYVELSGNNLDHANDFGHRDLCAVLLSALIPASDSGR